jgi:hypothetical protein
MHLLTLTRLVYHYIGTSLYLFQHGETAVHMAASGGHTEVIKFLNSKEVDIGALDKVS